MIIGIDPGAADYEAAEHVAHTVPDVLGLGATHRDHLVVSTHVVLGEVGRDAIAVTVPDHGLAVVGDLDEWVHGVVAAMPPTTGVVVTWGGRDDAVEAGPDPARAGAWGAVAQAATRSAGRLVHYPGRDLLRGRFPLAEVTQRSVVQDLDVVGGAVADPSATFDSRDYVRPIWRDGRVVLLLQPGAGGSLTPFEIEDPPRCCEFH